MHLVSCINIQTKVLCRYHKSKFNEQFKSQIIQTKQSSSRRHTRSPVPSDHWLQLGRGVDGPTLIILPWGQGPVPLLYGIGP